MPSAQVSIQINSLSLATSTFSSLHGATVVERMETESEHMLCWMHFLAASQTTGVADELLNGAVSSIREAAACAGLGLVRPAIFSIRMHIDLLLAWLYFKDHPVEWKTLNESGDGFKMKKDILEYLTQNFPGFKARLALLRDVIERTTEDPYRLLSAHVHAQSSVVIPAGSNLSDAVQDSTLALQCADVWKEVSEYVSDILVSVYALKWAALPAKIQNSVEKRLKNQNKHLERFFSGV